MKYYKIIYPCTTDDFKQKILMRTKSLTFLKKVSLGYSEEGNGRLYFAKAVKNQFSLYTLPNMMGPSFTTPWQVIWQGLSIWATPVHLYGKSSDVHT